MAAKQLITRKNEDLTKWYTDIITKAKLIHYGSIKGMMTFLPNAWAIWEQIQTYLNQRFKELEIQNIALPSLMPESLLEKESTHISGFNPELFKITSVGNKKLNECYVLRPTSEVIVSQVFHDLINSAKQLPILFNQWANVFRAEKNPRPFLRNCEFFWQEIHGAFASDQQAQQKAMQILNVYLDLLNNFLLIPTLSGEKTPNERFAGAKISYTLESIMPDGQALQCATSHYLGTTFSVAYDIKYQNSTNKFDFVKMISAGISTRILGGMIMHHGDDFGLVIPFQVAPVQIVINTAMDQKNHLVKETANKVYHTLKEKFRVKLDCTDKTISQKIIQCELDGIPIQIIIGPKETEKHSLIIYNRLDRCKKTVADTNYIEYLNKIVDYWKFEYYQKKLENQEKLICQVDNYNDFLKTLTDKKVALAPWGGDENDEVVLKQKCGATARCIKTKITEPSKIKCFFTNQIAREWIYFARAY